MRRTVNIVCWVALLINLLWVATQPPSHQVEFNAFVAGMLVAQRLYEWVGSWV